VDSFVKPQVLWGEPKTAVIEAPAPEEDEGSASVICTWIFGGSMDAVSAFSGSILAHYLLATETSPLKRALVDSGLGEDLDDMCGFDGELAQSVFSVGLRKSKPEHAQAVLDIVMDTLNKEAENGLDGELIEGAVRQAEFHLREITNGHFPYNLRLADKCYRSWLNGGDPFALLAFEKPLSIIKEEMAKGGFFENIIRKNLIENKHRLTSVIAASSEKGKKLEAQTAVQAARLTSKFTDEDRRHCVELTNTLREQQSTPPPPEALASLPMLHKSDLPKESVKVPFEKGDLGGAPLIAHPIFTSGIAYLDIGFDFGGVDEALIPFIPSYLEMLTRCGAGKYSYEQMAKRISLSTGGIDASTSCRTKIGASDELFFMAFIHGKALEPRFGEMLGILEDLIAAPDLKNVKQIKDMLLEGRNALNSSVIQSGHSFAVTNASARLSKSRKVDETVSGITQLRFLDAVIKKEDYGAVVEAFVGLHDFFFFFKACVVSITAGDPSKFTGQLESFVNKLPVKDKAGEKYLNNNICNIINVNNRNNNNHINNIINDNNIGKIRNDADDYHTNHTGKVEYHGIEINSAVNFVARAWKVPGLSAAEYGRLFLLSRNLSTGYLWDKIRVEGGAYGGMSGMSVSHPVFTCASYRDPNLEGTLEHFTKGLNEIVKLIPAEKTDQSIVGAIGRIDHPKTPHSAGFGETMDILTGNTFEYRQEFREALLIATPNDLKTAAERVLSSNESAVTVLGSSAAFDNAKSNGMVFEREKLLS
jgi:Zn-dependent M16 (insulinase) family peptidase